MILGYLMGSSFRVWNFVAVVDAPIINKRGKTWGERSLNCKLPFYLLNRTWYKLSYCASKDLRRKMMGDKTTCQDMLRRNSRMKKSRVAQGVND